MCGHGGSVSGLYAGVWVWCLVRGEGRGGGEIEGGKRRGSEEMGRGEGWKGEEGKEGEIGD